MAHVNTEESWRYPCPGLTWASVSPSGRGIKVRPASASAMRFLQNNLTNAQGTYHGYQYEHIHPLYSFLEAVVTGCHKLGVTKQ